MNIERESSTAATPPRLAGRFVASQALLWTLAASILGLAVARAAVWVENFRAPLVIFPLLVGCGLGLLLMAVMRLGQVGHRPTLWVGTALAVAIAVAGQHYFSFLDYKAALAAQKPENLATEAFQDIVPEARADFLPFMQRQAALGRPLTAGYILRGSAAWASWAIDGVLVLLATSTIIYVACRSPYCNVCRSWYRTTRAGTLAAETARRLADAASLTLEEPLGEVRYRLSHCVSGCGPSRLELACHGRERTKVVEAWLSAAPREQVMRALDGTDT